MAKCTGIRCPMQVGYKTEECNQTDCPYRTEPITNADRIRAMIDEELAVFFDETPLCPEPKEHCPCDCAKCWIEWLKQPAE